MDIKTLASIAKEVAEKRKKSCKTDEMDDTLTIERRKSTRSSNFCLK